MDRNFLLSVKDLKTYFYLREGILKAVDDVSFELYRGEVLGLVGESGSGKSITARSILRMVKPPGKTEGEILFCDNNHSVDLMTLDPNGNEIRRIRGDKINMIFQEPMNAFSPIHTIGDQIIEGILLHRNMSRKEARDLTIKLLEDVGISNPKQRIDEYPFQLSGGMRQRAMIAMAIACQPMLLIADEPTTALDVSVQAQILRLLKDLQIKYNMSIIFITHDLAVIAQMAERVIVMYLGQIMEEANVEDIFYSPLHPYTKKLLASVPDISKKSRRLQTIEGHVPEPINLPKRCVFCSRCSERIEGKCDQDIPPIVEVAKNHKIRCFRYVS